MIVATLLPMLRPSGSLSLSECVRYGACAARGDGASLICACAVGAAAWVAARRRRECLLLDACRNGSDKCKKASRDITVGRLAGCRRVRRAARRAARDAPHQTASPRSARRRTHTTVHSRRHVRPRGRRRWGVFLAGCGARCLPISSRILVYRIRSRSRLERRTLALWQEWCTTCKNGNFVQITF